MILAHKHHNNKKKTFRVGELHLERRKSRGEISGKRNRFFSIFIFMGQNRDAKFVKISGRGGGGETPANLSFFICEKKIQILPPSWSLENKTNLILIPFLLICLSNISVCVYVCGGKGGINVTPKVSLRANKYGAVTGED